MLKFGEIQNIADPNASVDQESLNVGLLEDDVLPWAYTGYTSGWARMLVLVNYVKFMRNSVIEFKGIRTIWSSLDMILKP